MVFTEVSSDFAVWIPRRPATAKLVEDKANGAVARTKSLTDPAAAGWDRQQRRSFSLEELLRT